MSVFGRVKFAWCMVKDDALIMEAQYHLINLSCLSFQIYKPYSCKMIPYFCDNV